MQRLTWVVVLALCSGCTTTYTFIFDYGGSMSIALEPDGEGVALDIELAGLSEAELDEIPKRGDWAGWDCPGPHIHYATDTGTGEPVASSIQFCATAAQITGACPDTVRLVLEVDGDTGGLYLDMDPVDNGAPGDQLTAFGDLDVDGPMLATSGTAETTIELDDGCLTNPIEHRLTLTWNFPEHAVRTNTVRDEIGYVPPGA